MDTLTPIVLPPAADVDLVVGVVANAYQGA